VVSRIPAVPWWLHSGLAVVAAMAAFWLTLLLNLQDRPFFLPTIAVLVMALRGGLTAGMISGITALLLVNHFIIPHPAAYPLPGVKDSYELAVFAVTALIISVLAASRRDAQLTLEATLGSIGDGVIVTDKQARVRFLNKVAEELTGWARPWAGRSTRCSRSCRRRRAGPCPHPSAAPSTKASSSASPTTPC
jgi:PAS domain-containing protein